MKTVAGWLTLGTELDTSKFDKQLTKLENRLKQEQLDLEVKDTAVERYIEKISEVQKKLDEAKKKQKELNETIAEEQKYLDNMRTEEWSGRRMSKSDVLKMSRSEENVQIYKAEQQAVNEEVRKYDELLTDMNVKAEQLEASYKHQEQKVKDTENQIKEVNAEIERQNTLLEKSKFPSMKEVVNGIEKGAKKVTSSIRGWVIALIGIRSAYSFIRSSISLISQNNKQLSTDLQYIKYALASSLEPIIIRIVEWIYKLLQYLGYIIKAWTGKNIFENANKGLAKANKQASSLQKTLQQAAFDEMNILNDNRSGGAGGGDINPSVDLSKLNGKVPKWIEWIGRNGKLLLSVLAGAVAAVAAIKLGLTAIQSLGIGIAVAGIVYAIQSIIDYINDPSWDNFGDILIGLALAVGGVAIAIGAWPVAVAAAVALAIGLIIKFWDDIKEFLEGLASDIENFGNNLLGYLYEEYGAIGAGFGGVIKWITDKLSGFIRTGKELLGEGFQNVKNVLDSIIKIFKGDFSNGIYKILTSLLKMVVDVINTVIKGINYILTPFRAVIVVAAKVLGKDWTMDDVKIPLITMKGIENDLSDLSQPTGGSAYAATSGLSAMLNNGATNAASTLSNFSDEATSKLASQLSEKMKLTSNFIVNGRTIIREVSKFQNENNFAFNK